MGRVQRWFGSALALALLAAVEPAAAQVGVTASASQSPATVRPGQVDVSYLTITITSSLGVHLTGITLTNATAGSGAPAQLDAAIGTIRLYQDDGDGLPEPSQDILIGQTVASGGRLRYAPIDVEVPTMGSLRLHAIGTIPLTERDGDVLDLSVQAAADMTFNPAITPSNAFPLSPAGGFPVDGMSAAQISLVPVLTDSLLAPSQDALALHVVLPSNGYQADQLEELAVVNEGTAAPGADITGVRAWVETGDTSFNPLTDRCLGSLAFTGSRWQLTGLSEPVPTSGLHVYFTVDVADLASEGRTVRLGLPPSPAAGIGMRSANDGPVDASIRNSLEQRISAADRVTWSASAIPPLTVRPGDGGVALLSVEARNTYSASKVLTSLTVTNATLGSGTQADRDGEIQSLTLWADGNGNGSLETTGADPVLGTATFQSGRAVFGGLAWVIPTGAPSRFFVTADVSLADASDSDAIALVVEGSLDVAFSDPTRVTALWPLDSGVRATVDGMVAAQVVNFGAPVATVAPGDGPVLVLDIVLPRNGYASDLLDSLEVVNLGDADLGDVARLDVWRDGGDGLFSRGSGDDQLLGRLTWQGDRWSSALLADSIPTVGTRLFVGLTVSSTPRDSATVRLAIPTGGIANRSGNDGPVDHPIANPGTITISNAPLLATLRFEEVASTVGQSVHVSMVVRNASGESVTGVVPSSLGLSGSGVLTLTGGPIPSALDLTPAESDTFHWTYAATGSGDATFSGSAQGTGSPSGLPRQSLAAPSNTHRIYDSVAELPFSVSPSMPATVTRGQADVIPFTLVFRNVGEGQVAPARVTGLRIRLEDGSGNGIVPSDVLSGVTVADGTTVLLRKTSLESSGAEVELALATPALAPGGEEIALSLRLDIASTATAPSVRVVIADSTWLSAQDANSGAPIAARLQAGSYPVRSSVARLVSEATRLEVGPLASAPDRVGRGEPAVPLLRLRVENPGLSGITSDVRISSFEIELTDSNGTGLARAADYLRRITVRTAFQVLADRGIFSTDGSTLTLVLSPPLAVPVNTPLDLTVFGDVAPDAPAETFRAQLGDSAEFDARDAGTGSSIPVRYAIAPLVGPSIRIESAAGTLALRGSPMLPSQLTVGRTDVLAISALLRHPGSAGTSRIRADSLVIQVRNESRQPLVPSAYLSRLRALWNGSEVASRSDLPSAGGSVAVSLAGSLLEPGDSAVVHVLIDVAASAPAGSLELMVFEAGVRTADANLGSAVTAVPDTGAELPLTSGLARLVPPARQLVVDLLDRMPAMLAADGNPVPIGALTLTNAAPSSSDSIFLDHLVLRAGDRALSPVPIGSAAVRIEALVGGSVWAETNALAGDSLSAWLAAGSRLGVAAGQTIEVTLRIVPRATGSTAFRLGCDAAGIGIIQPGGALLQIEVQPAPGRAFPLWTEVGSLAGLTLRETYSNFPNPFPAGRAATTFAYYLRENGRVTLRVYTSSGEAVATLVDTAPRAQGIVQSDLWDGRNGAGHVVRNGVYFAELSVEYDDGSRERVLRKVAVLR